MKESSIEDYIINNAIELASYCQTESKNIKSIYIDLILKDRIILVLANCEEMPSKKDKELLEDIGFNITANFDEVGKAEYIYKVSAKNYSSLNYKIYPI